MSHEVEESPLLPQDKPIEPKPSRRAWLGVIFLGIAFWFVFTAFNTTQNLETTVNKDIGRMSLGILYGVFTVSTLVASAVVTTLGPRASLFLGGLLYTLYVAANIPDNPVLLLVASGLVGFGAAILWVAQGTFLSGSATTSTMGVFSGLFFTLFQLNQVTGNLLGTLVLHAGIAPRILFVIFTIISCCGILIFLILPMSHLKTVHSTDSLKRKLSDVARLLIEPRLLWLAPLCCYFGLSQEFFFGSFTAHLNSPSRLTAVMTVFGACDAFGSVLGGKISDFVGRKPVVLTSTVLLLSGLVGASLSDGNHNAWLAYVTAGAFGFSDSQTNTQLYAIVGHVFPDRREAAFASMRLFQALFTSGAFWWGIVTPWMVKVLLMAATIIAGVLCLFVMDARVARIDSSQKRVN